jgi:hypothetical protein
MAISPDIQDHAFFKALAGLLDVGLKHYIVQGGHRELNHSGDLDRCPECAPICRTLDVRGAEERARLFESMRDFADRFGY